MMKTSEKNLALPNLTTIKHLLPKYDAYIVDLWGVVHDGVNPYPGVVECLNHLISLNKKIIFLTNAPRPASVLIKKLKDFGIKTNLEMMLSSGDVVIEQLKHFNDPVFSQLGHHVYHLGANRNQDILSQPELQIELTESIENANFLLVSAYMDANEDLNQYDTLLQKAASLHLPFICTNPDKEIPFEDEIRYCAGFLAEKYERMGGVVHYYGKPYLSIYKGAFQRLAKLGILDKKRMLMIGDTLETDIKGANLAGLDSALVLGGNTQLLLDKQNGSNSSTAELLLELFQETKASPTWVLEGLNLNEA